MLCRTLNPHHRVHFHRLGIMHIRWRLARAYHPPCTLRHSLDCLPNYPPPTSYFWQHLRLNRCVVTIPSALVMEQFPISSHRQPVCPRYNCFPGFHPSPFCGQSVDMVVAYVARMTLNMLPVNPPTTLAHQICIIALRRLHQRRVSARC